MISVDIDGITAIIREIAEAQILSRFRNLRSGDVAFKVGDDPVTIADKEAESALSTRLSGLLKESKVVGEEAFAANPRILEAFSGESPVWIIDPIDGTRNFVGGNPEFGVIIALAQQNQTIAGWIYDPCSGEVVTAEKGSGAWYMGIKLKTMPPVSLERMSGFMGDRLFLAHQKANLSSKIEPIFEKMHAGAHEYPRLVIDGPHFGKDKQQVHFRTSYYYSTPWDDAAGVLIHQEAGGYSALWDGSSYRPSVMHMGFAATPDKESWHALKKWCRSFADLP